MTGLKPKKIEWNPKVQVGDIVFFEGPQKEGKVLTTTSIGFVADISEAGCYFANYNLSHYRKLTKL